MANIRRISRLAATLLMVAGAAGGLLAMFSAVSAHRRETRDRWVGRWRAATVGAMPYGAIPADLDSLQQLLIGLGRAEVMKALGLPPAAAMTPTAVEPVPMDQPHSANVWYYPVDLPRRLAIAVTFEADIAQRVEWLSGPP